MSSVERVLAPSARLEMRLCLYVAGEGPNSVLALTNLRALLASRGVHAAIEVVDVLAEPERGLQAGILVTPTLLKLAPPPARSIIGNLSDSPAVVAALGLESHR